MEGLLSMGFQWLLGLGAGVAVVDKILSFAKYTALAKGAVNVVDDILEAMKDKQITPEEVKLIAASCKSLKEAYLAVKK